VADRYTQRRIFEAEVHGRPTGKLTWQWDFGDGQTARGRRVEHVYLTPGTYTVTLRASGHATPLVSSYVVRVDRPWDLVTRRKLDPRRDHAELISAYDFAALPAEGNVVAMELFTAVKAPSLLDKAGKAFVSRQQGDGKQVRATMELYADWLIDQGRFGEAIYSLKKLSKLTADASAAAEALVRAGQVELHQAGQPAEAMKTFEGVLETYGVRAPEPARLARIGLGDLYRLAGEHDQAKAAYDQAGPGSEDARKRPAIVKGDLARHVEAYIRTREYEAAEEYLRTWGQVLPGDRLEGYWSLLRARLAEARRDDQAVVSEARVLVRVNPRSNYAPQLLMLAADACGRLDRLDERRSLLKAVVQDYAESPLSRKAAELLSVK
jgi:tetratricopeptide (TPR) repeat protein